MTRVLHLCSALGGLRRGFSAGLAVLSLLILGLSSLAQTAPSAAPSTAPALRAAVIRLEGQIDDYSGDVILKHLEAARRSDPQVIIFHITTPGGVLGATLDMTRAVRALPKGEVRTVAFIEKQAYSAGTIFAVACDEIYMAPESAIGDCAPIMVTQTGLQTLGDAERAKMSSPVVADMYASAERNGYNSDLLAAMVLPGRIVHALRSPSGALVIADPTRYAELIKTGHTPVVGAPDPLDGADTLLTVDTRLAERVGLSKGTYGSPQALASAMGWTIQETLAPTAGQKVVQFLNSATLRGLLVTVFMISMYLSFQVPGHGLPEAVCLTSLATLLIVPLMTGYASWLEISLILLGIALIALELFVFTGTLLPGIVGAASLLLGLVLTFVPRELPSAPGEWTPPSFPSLPGTWDAVQTGFGVVVLSLVISLALVVWLARYLPQLPFASRLILTATTGTPASSPSSSVGRGAPSPARTALREPWPPLNATATTTTDLLPGGHAELPDPDGPGTRTIAVLSDSGFIPKATKVRVVEVEGTQVTVRRA